MKGKPSTKVTQTSVILRCGCSQLYQDSRYGIGLRVHTRTKQNKAEIDRSWRCTGCGREHR